MPHNFGTNLLPLCALLANKSIVKFLLTFSYVQDGQLKGLSVPASALVPDSYVEGQAA